MCWRPKFSNFFNSFHNRVEFGTSFCRALGISGGGDLNTPNPLGPLFVGYILVHLWPLCDDARTVPRVLTYWTSRTHCTVTQRYETWLKNVSQETKLAGTLEVQWRKLYIILWDWQWETGFNLSGRRHANYNKTHSHAITRTQTHAHVCVMITNLVSF